MVSGLNTDVLKAMVRAWVGGRGWAVREGEREGGGREGERGREGGKESGIEGGKG